MEGRPSDASHASEVSFGWGASTAVVRPRECTFVSPRTARKAARLHLSDEIAARVGGCALLYVMHDPDAPTGYVHWVTVRNNVEGTAPAPVPYVGPSPPAGEVHTYNLCVFCVPLHAIREAADALRKWFRDRNKRRDNFSINEIVALLPRGTKLAPDLVFKFRSGFSEREDSDEVPAARATRTRTGAGSATHAERSGVGHTQGNAQPPLQQRQRGTDSSLPAPAPVRPAASATAAAAAQTSAAAAAPAVRSSRRKMTDRNAVSVVLRHYARHVNARRALARANDGEDAAE